MEDRGSELGDTVTVNFDGKFLDEPEEEDIKSEDVDVTLGGKGVQQEFTDNLIGREGRRRKDFCGRLSCGFLVKRTGGKEG